MAAGRRRSYGEGSLYRRASDGRWIGAVEYPAGDGRRHRRTVSGRTRREATERLRELRSALAAGLPPVDRRITVGQFLERWLTEVLAARDLSPNTLDNYAWAVRNHIVPALGGRRLVELSPVEVGRFLRQKRDQGYGGRSVARLHSVLKMALAFGVETGAVLRNVAEIVHGPGGPRVDGRALTPTQAHRLLRVVRGERFEAAVVVMLMLGLRPGETFGLRWADIDLEGRALEVRQTLKKERGCLLLGPLKTKHSRRSLALPAPVVASLLGHRR